MKRLLPLMILSAAVAAGRSGRMRWSGFMSSTAAAGTEDRGRRMRSTWSNLRGNETSKTRITFFLYIKLTSYGGGSSPSSMNGSSCSTANGRGRGGLDKDDGEEGKDAII